MHVAVVSPYDPRPDRDEDPQAVRGGVEEALDRAAAGLAARGHDVTVVTSAERASDTYDHDGVRFVRVRRRGVLFRNPIAPLGAAIPTDADVVHVPATYPGVSDLIPSRERRRGRATVLDYHFDVHGTSAAMCAAAYMHRVTLGRLMTSATRIVTKSLDYARFSTVLSALPQSRLDWVPNAVDVDEFQLNGGSGSDILCVGRLVPYKGVGTLIRAMPRIHEQTGARLLLAGDGPDRARLMRLADELDAPVEFLGRVPRADLVALYAKARLNVLPSANSQEAFGITLLESLASGTPVIASDLPGVREVARLGGLTAPPNDPQALAAAVVAAYESPEQFGTPAELRAAVRKQYAWPVVVERLEQVYEAALRETLTRARPGSLPSRRPTAGGAQ